MKPTSLDNNIVFQCADFSHRFTTLLKTEFRNQGLDLTPEQLSILVALWYKGKATQQEISKQLRRDKTTITRVVQNMEKNGLISFSQHPTDNRSRLASVTAKGERLQNAAIRVSGSLYTRVLTNIPVADLGIAIKVLGRMTRNCVLILGCWLAAFSLHAQNKNLLARKYRIGDVYRYRLTCEQTQNGKWTSTQVSICTLTVVRDSAGNPNDEIRWDSLWNYTPKDTLNEWANARATKPYRVSLGPGGPMALPPLTDPDMVEPITDFHTFLVAIHPFIGIDSLRKPGDSIANTSLAIGNFADGKSIPKGEDCLATIARLTSLDGTSATLESSFLPPLKPGLTYLLPEMDTPVVAGIPNNFQMVMAAGPQHFHLQYGREYFVVHSTLSTKDGKLQKGDMFNKLTLKMKINCDEHYQQCQAELPFAIERKLILELIP
jgi:DNA-binding MarR family transcriptional regulator